MPLDIHFGVREIELPTMRSQIHRLVNQDIGHMKIETDDIPWDPDNFNRVQHAIIETMSPVVTINFITSNFINFLVPATQENIHGVMIFITDKGAPTQEYLEFRFPPQFA